MLHQLLKQYVQSSLTKRATLLVSFLALGLTACGKAEVKVNPPAPAVSVYSIKSEATGSYREFVARTEAFQEADLIARVEGELLARHFREGSFVEKGQVLLQIDPAAYEAALSSATADLSSRVSGETNAKNNLKRGKELVSDGYISSSDFDKLTTEESQAKSAVKAAEAALEKAKLDLSYTTIKAPFTGRVGKVDYNVGNIVGPTSGTLANIIVTDPIYVSFQVEESTYVSYQQKNQGKAKSTTAEFDISIRLPNNSQYPEQGQLDFADTKISEGMGTVELRTVFANPNNIILPGLFVTLILESQDKEKMSLIPQAAVQENQQGKFVLIVDGENNVVQRHVILGRRINAMWVVEKGVSDGEMVIIEGQQKVQAGVKVKAVEKSVDPVVGTISDLDNKLENTSKATAPIVDSISDVNANVSTDK